MIVTMYMDNISCLAQFRNSGISLGRVELFDILVSPTSEST